MESNIQLQSVHEILLQNYPHLIDKNLSILKFCGHAGKFYYIPEEIKETLEKENWVFQKNIQSAFYNYTLPPYRKYEKGSNISDDFYVTHLTAEEICEIRSMENSDFILDDQTYEFFVRNDICMRDDKFYTLPKVDHKELRIFQGKVIDHSYGKELLIFTSTENAIEMQPFDFIILKKEDKPDAKIRILDFICILNKELKSDNLSIVRIFKYQDIGDGYEY